ncbi:MAG: hypothetical protein ACFB12_03140 [Leptolyngbyaceae cyanobacterium]
MMRGDLNDLVFAIALNMVTARDAQLKQDWRECRYRVNVRKAYAAERDFNHLKNNYRQLAESMNNLYRFSDEAKDEIMRELILLRAAIEKPEI